MREKPARRYWRGPAVANDVLVFPDYPSPRDMLTIQQKAIATLVIVGLNVLVFLFMSWFVVLTAIPSFLFLLAILTR